MRLRKEGQIARLKVINLSEDGAFLDVGAERGIFMPYAGMYAHLQLNEVVWAKLYTDKSGRLALTMKVENEIRRASKPAHVVKLGSILTGHIYNITEKGAFIFTTERYIVHVPQKDIPRHLRVGEEVKVRVTFVRPDGRLNGSLRPTKEDSLLIDAKMLLKELEFNKKLPYTDKTPPDIIFDRFKITKAAFKRAVGHLFKTQQAKEENGWLIYIGKK